MKKLLILLCASALFAVGCATTLELEVGTCFQDPDGLEITDVDEVDCTEPHDNEVFHLLQLADGDFPGREAITSQAGDGCTGAFEAYVGRDFPSSEYFLSFIAPSEDSWDRADDREVICYLFIPGEQTSTSARGSGR
ncbi:MAG: septum formation family protein [Actinomycetota bacterium]